MNTSISVFTLSGLSNLTALLVCLCTQAGVHAHGTDSTHALPDASKTGIQRGIEVALNCDHTIHELLGEYAVCMRENHAHVGADAAAETAFRFMAWLRASTAAWQGYADGPDYQQAFEQDLRRAQGRHRVPAATLCAAIGVKCETLPYAPPVGELPPTLR